MRQAKHVRAAIYTRISLDATGREEGVERQEKYCREWAERAGWPVEEVFCDNSVSASKPGGKRPEYERMTRAVEDGSINAVIFWDIDRLTRQPRQLEWWLDQCKYHGLDMADAKGGDMALDTRSPMGELFLRMRATFAAYEVAHKGERQRAANKDRADKGLLFTGARPIGYVREMHRDEQGRLRVARVVEDEAEVVRAVYRAFLRGASLDAIARALSGEAEDGLEDVPCVPRPAYTKAVEFNKAHPDRPRELPPEQPWYSATVRLMLRNPKYAAYVGYTPTSKSKKGGDGSGKWYSMLWLDGDGHPVSGAWEPIIDRETWWRVQDVLDDSARRTNLMSPKVRRHIGSGLFRCGVCGHTLHIQGGKGGSYVCPNHAHGESAHVCALASYTDKYVEVLVEKYLGREEVRASFVIQRGARASRDYEAEVARQERLIEKAEREYNEGIIEGRDLQGRRERARERIEAIRVEQRREADEATRAVMPREVAEAIDPAKAFHEADLATKRAALDFLLDVRIDPVKRKGGTRDGKHGGVFDFSRIRVTPKVGEEAETAA